MDNKLSNVTVTYTLNGATAATAVYKDVKEIKHNDNYLVLLMPSGKTLINHNNVISIDINSNNNEKPSDAMLDIIGDDVNDFMAYFVANNKEFRDYLAKQNIPVAEFGYCSEDTKLKLFHHFNKLKADKIVFG